MSAATLLDEFRRVSEAPGAVPRLRSLVVELAVRGQLVGRASTRQPGVRLPSKDSLPEGRGFSGDGNCYENPLPFLVPEGWVWMTFSDVADVRSDLVSPADFPDLPLIAPDNIESGTGSLLAYSTVRASGFFSSKHHFVPGLILYSKIRPALRKVVSVDFEGLCSADMYPIFPHIDRDFLQLYMLSETFTTQSVAEANRVAMPKINRASLARILVPVPPVREQPRIAAVASEVLALCDDLAGAQSNRDMKRTALLDAAIVDSLI